MDDWAAYSEPVPGDGTCLYHSIAKHLGIGGHNLRQITHDFMKEYLESSLHGQSIRDWIQWDSKNCAENYIDGIKSGAWGGALEITIIATIFRVPIFVYVARKNACNQISESIPDETLPFLNGFKTSPPYICVLYNGKNHYEILHCKQSF